MSSQPQIVDVRVYADSWLICDLQAEGKPPVCRTLREGRLRLEPEGDVDWLGVRESRGEPHWLDWLFDAPEPRRRHSIAPDGRTIEWPELGRSVSLDELLERSGPGGLYHRWRRGHLRDEVSQDELAGFWHNLDSLRLVELGPDGRSEQKENFRGKPATVAGTFTWRFESPRRFEVRHELERPLPALGDAPPIRAHWFEYRVMRFDGTVLELLETGGNGVVVTGPWPIWWIRAKPPRGR